MRPLDQPSQAAAINSLTARMDGQERGRFAAKEHVRGDQVFTSVAPGGSTGEDGPETPQAVVRLSVRLDAATTGDSVFTLYRDGASVATVTVAAGETEKIGSYLSNPVVFQPTHRWKVTNTTDGAGWASATVTAETRGDVPHSGSLTSTGPAVSCVEGDVTINANATEDFGPVTTGGQGLVFARVRVTGSGLIDVKGNWVVDGTPLTSDVYRWVETLATDDFRSSSVFCSIAGDSIVFRLENTVTSAGPIHVNVTVAAIPTVGDTCCVVVPA